MFSLEPNQLIGTFVSSTLYSLLISWGPIRRMDDDPEWRWLITTGGVALVLAMATRGGAQPATLLDLMVCFGIASVPVWIRAAAFRHTDRTRQQIDEAYRAGGQV